MIWAAKVDHRQVAEQLLRSGANVNEQEGAASHSQKFTALHMGCYKKHIDFVRLLLDWPQTYSEVLWSGGVDGLIDKAYSDMKWSLWGK